MIVKALVYTLSDCPQGSSSGVELVGGCLLVSSSGRTGQLTLHDYWAAVAEDKDHTDSW